jgi:hypothetical protein
MTSVGDIQSQPHLRKLRLVAAIIDSYSCPRALESGGNVVAQGETF